MGVSLLMKELTGETVSCGQLSLGEDSFNDFNTDQER